MRYDPRILMHAGVKCKRGLNEEPIEMWLPCHFANHKQQHHYIEELRNVSEKGKAVSVTLQWGLNGSPAIASRLSCYDMKLLIAPLIKRSAKCSLY